MQLTSSKRSLFIFHLIAIISTIMNMFQRRNLLVVFVVHCCSIADAQFNQQRPPSSSNLVDPYYAFNPDYKPVNSQSNLNNIPGSCSCTCGETSFTPPIRCDNADICVSYCLQTFPAHCTIVNTYGCCGVNCRYFETQSHDTRLCTCNCANQQFIIQDSKCSSGESCLTRCINKFPLQCKSENTQACCGQDCQSVTQRIAGSCACTCQGSTHYPAPTCSDAEGCISTCMTTYSQCTAEQTQGCCGQMCSSYVPTCSCTCGDFRRVTSIPCQSGQSCLETCTRSYGACTQENTQACCGMNCVSSFASCSCRCGNSPNIPLPMQCGSSMQCAQACVNTGGQCNVMNTVGCCGNDCAPFIPTCQCQCGSNMYFTTSTCVSPERCADECMRQYGHVCRPTNTVGCCNGTLCTRQSRLLGFNHGSRISFSLYTMMLFVMIKS